MAAIGCGSDRPDRVPVAGQVLIDGEPVEHGFVRLIADNARPATGELRPGGRFELTCFAGQDGSTLGTHTVTVTGVEQLGPTSQRWYAPKKYANAKTSGLKATVNDATDSLVIELTWAGGHPFVETFTGGE